MQVVRILENYTPLSQLTVDPPAPAIINSMGWGAAVGGGDASAGHQILAGDLEGCWGCVVLILKSQLYSSLIQSIE